MANGKRTDQQQIMAAERRMKALELRKAAQSYRAIGDRLGVSGKTAWEDVQAALGELAELEQVEAAALRALESARLDTLAVEAMRVLLARHPYVSGGKVLKGVTDDGPKLAAIDRLLRISERRARLYGLDAPAKTALTNPDGTAYETQQQMIGVVLNLLAPYPELRPLLAAQLLEERDDIQDEPGHGP